MRKFCLSIVASLLLVAAANARQTVRLDLSRTILLATDSSLTADKYRSVYDQSRWEYLAYAASRKPQFRLESTPVSYDRYLVQRYLSDEDRDVYRQQRLYYGEASVTVSQTFEPLGGTFYGSTGLGYLSNFGEYNYSQFTTVPILVGYKQELFGFNALKWQRKIEEQKMTAAEKTLSFNKEETAAQAAEKFFDLVMAQFVCRAAIDDSARCDTVYTIGQRKFNIASISKAELLTLEIDRQNAENALINARLQLSDAMRNLADFLNMEPDTRIELVVPSATPTGTINLDEALRYARENNPSAADDRRKIIEAERDVERAKVENRLNLGFDLRVGLNQVHENLWRAYGHPLLQDYAAVNLSLPLKDWGVGKYKISAATEALESARKTAEINLLDAERDVRSAVLTFNEQQALVNNTGRTRDIADEAYNNTFLRFASGKATVNDITLAQNRRQTALKNHIAAICNCWMSYFQVRKATLHDFFPNK